MRSFLVFVMIAALLIRIEHCRRAIHILACAMPPILLLAAGLGASGDRFHMGRGTFGNSNDLATHLLMGLPFCIFVVWNHRRPAVRLLAAAMVPPLLVIVLRTGSRGALVTVVAMAVVVFLRLSLVQKLMVSAVLVVMTLVLYQFVPEATKARYRTIFMETESAGALDRTAASALQSKEGRIQLLKESLRTTLENPLLGVGPGQFSVAYTAKLNSRGIFHHTYRETHNAYTQVSSEAGIPALLLYAAVLVGSFRSCNRLYRHTRSDPAQKEVSRMAVCLMLSLTAFAVSSLFTSAAYMFYFPLLAGLCTAFRNAAEAEVPGLLRHWQRPAPLAQSGGVVTVAAQAGVRGQALPGAASALRRATRSRRYAN
jgi:O-antigen ligase